MKNKTGLFVTVLAAALFLGGCASIPDTAMEFIGNSYAHYTERVTWEQAKKKCEDLGGHLVIINSKEENDFIVKTLFGDKEWAGPTYQDSQKWIGAYENPDGIIVWVSPNGKKVSETYNNWWSGDPLPFKRGHSKYGRYVHICPTHPAGKHIAGTWTNDSSDEKGLFGRLGFICEWE